MDTQLVQKCIRWFVVAFMFLTLTTVIGMQTREAHQFFFVLGIMVIFGLLLRNIWITLFLWWTVILYVFFKFSGGHVYMQNVFFGCVLYFLTKLSFKKEHLNYFFNGFLCLVAINLIYMIVQICGMDWIYMETLGIKGFMGAEGINGTFIALAVPVIATRKSKYSLLCAIMMFAVLWYSKSVVNIGAAGIGLLFVIWDRFNRLARIAIIGALLAFSTYYVCYVDAPQMGRIHMWRLAMADTTLHPVSGNGLDSFRNITKKKNHVYISNLGYDEKKMIYSARHWDNPHNLFISLAYEWGFFSWFLLGGLIWDYRKRYIKSPKFDNTKALAGVGIVLLLASIAHFPMFLARFVVFLVPMLALYEVQTT